MGTLRDDLVGRTLGNCTLERLIGQGGMGSVYLAQQDRPARTVAVKVLLPNITHNSELYAQFLARFRREGDVIAKLEHVNIMPIYAYAEQDEIAYLVMPHLSGGSLREVLARRGALPPLEVAHYLDQAASALDYAHAQGVIHRDLKPANFLLHADGRLVLTDFGIARILQNTQEGAELTGTGMLLGTAEYMAPEMVRGEKVDYRTDIYELGIVLFQMLSGHVPFSGTTLYSVAIRHIQEPLPLLSMPGLPSAVNEVLQKATAKRPEERYSSVQEMAWHFRRAINSTLTSGYMSHSTTLSTTSTIAPAPVSTTLNEIVPPTQQAQRGSSSQTPLTVRSSWSSGANEPTYQTPLPSVPPVTPIGSKRQRPWFLLIGMPVLILLIVAGILLGPQLLRTSTPPGPTRTPSPIVTHEPASTPVSYSTGAQLYTTNSPACNDDSHSWTRDTSVNITCQSNGTQISYNDTESFLQGVFLASLPGQSYPSNYVVQAHIQNGSSVGGSFGLYFRNQPGRSQFGVYSFLIHSDESWDMNVYDNTTGHVLQLAGGHLTDSTIQTLAVVVQGTQFTLYANNKKVESVSDSTYSSGTTGIVVDKGAAVIVNQFTLYAVAS